MYSSAVVIGRVVEAFEDHGAKFLVVHTKDTPKFQGHVACRFYGDAGKWADRAANGDLVRIDGEPSSRNAKGRWYTEFNARYLEVLTPPAAKAAADDNAPAGDDSSIPF
jgi:hypothetical protein